MNKQRNVYLNKISSEFTGVFDSLEELLNYPDDIAKESDFAFIPMYNKKHTKIIRYDKYVYINGEWKYTYSLKGNEHNGK